MLPVCSLDPYRLFVLTNVKGQTSFGSVQFSAGRSGPVGFGPVQFGRARFDWIQLDSIRSRSVRVGEGEGGGRMGGGGLGRLAWPTG